MRDGFCPKCNSDEIYKQDHYTIRISRFLNVPRVIYVCSDCGYCEQYVEDKRLSDIKTKWTRIIPRRKRKNDEE